MDDFRDAAFVQSGPNRRFLHDFLHKTGILCKILSEQFSFRRVRREISGPEREIPSPGILFSGLGFFFRDSYGKIPVQKRFRCGSGAVFRSRWNLSPNTFPGSFCRRNPPVGFPADRVSAPGVPHVPSKGQVWRGFRDILISAWHVWLRSFRAVPARRPDTRISEGENEQIVNAHPNVPFCQWKDVRRGRRTSFRAEIRRV